MARTVRAKFRCESITDFGDQKTAKLRAISGNTGEDKDFTELTPYGEISIGIQSGAPASTLFEPKKDYYLTFTAASAE